MLANGRGGMGLHLHPWGFSVNVPKVSHGPGGLGSQAAPGLISPPPSWLPEAFGGCLSLLMECQPPGRLTPLLPSQSCVPGLRGHHVPVCALLGLEGWESSVDHSDATAPKEMTSFQMTLCPSW